MDNDYIKDYLSKQQELLKSLPQEQIVQLIDIFKKAWEEERQIFVCGNGGSAANASHFITDLSKAASDTMDRRFKGMTLNDNVSWMTALGNDYSYEDIFVGQLKNFAQEGDLVMALSVSGNSPNVVKAMKWANEQKLQTIALVGGKKGALSDLASFSIVVEGEHYGRVEDTQMSICHMICYAFIEDSQIGK